MDDITVLMLVSPMVHRRAHGFPGEEILVVPASTTAETRKIPLLRDLYPTDIGIFPCASGHFRTRKNGCAQWILMICLAGAGFFSLGGGPRKSVRAGQYILLPPGRAHEYGAADEEPWTILWVHFTGERASDYAELCVRDAEGNRGSVPSERGRRIAELHEDILRRLSGACSTDSLIAAAGALGYLLSLLPARREPGVTDAENGDRIASAQRFLQTVCDRPHRLGDLASRFAYSPSRFIALFKQRTGFPPVEYSLRMRIRAACRLLDASTLGIKEVAGRVGFGDPLYFSRQFRRVMGTCPEEYRGRPKG